MDWQQEKQTILKNATTLVIKVGSAVLSSGTELNLEVLAGLVSQLAALRKQGRRVVLVSSGAVAAGRTALLPLGVEISGLSGKQAAAAVGQGRLMQHYEQHFASHQVLSAQVLLTREDLRSRERFLNIRNTFSTLLDWGVVPIVNENDTVSVAELKFTDNDNLASLLLNVVEADLFVNLTTIGGVLDKNPLEHEDAAIMPVIDSVRRLNLNLLCGGKTAVGTGGMYAKLLAAGRAAQLGVPTFILPGTQHGVITRAMDGEAIGTWVRPTTRSVSRRKYWLAYQTEAHGSVHIDAGAGEALEQRGKSLLPVGVQRVEGAFKAGHLVRIVCEGRVLGVGLSNYDATALAGIVGKKRHEVAALLGNAHYPEVVHRDNMLLDATV